MARLHADEKCSTVLTPFRGIVHAVLLSSLLKYSLRLEGLIKVTHVRLFLIIYLLLIYVHAQLSHFLQFTNARCKKKLLD